MLIKMGLSQGDGARRTTITETASESLPQFSRTTPTETVPCAEGRMLSW
jgi:hypothetical protein